MLLPVVTPDRARRIAAANVLARHLDICDPRIIKNNVGRVPRKSPEARVGVVGDEHEMLRLGGAAAAARTVAASAGQASTTIGMSFWTDAAVLGGAGIPSVLFGPTGAGLHSLEEWVDIGSVLTCRDALVNLARRWCV